MGSSRQTGEVCGRFCFYTIAFVIVAIAVFEISLVLVTAMVLIIPLAFVGFIFWDYRNLEVTVNKRELQVN
jgi:hypothetical protein